jgi:hypothetical protein
MAEWRIEKDFRLAKEDQPEKEEIEALSPKQIEQITKGAKRGFKHQEPNFDECMGDIVSTSTEDFDQDFFDAHESEIYKIVAQVVAAQIVKSYQ